MDANPEMLLGLAYQAAIDSQKTVTFQTHLPAGCDQETIDNLLDTCRKALERQLNFADIAREQKNADANETEADRLEKELHLLDDMLQKQELRYAARAAEHDGRAEFGLTVTEQKDRDHRIAERDQKVLAISTAKQKATLARHRVEELRASLG